jgi:hypothetical protein
MSWLWMSIEPQEAETRLELSEGGRGVVLRARLPQLPRQERALATLLEALSAWYGRSLTAVLDADAQDVAQHPERRLLAELDGERIRVQWVSVPRLAFRRDRFLGRLGGGRRHRELVGFAATGQPCRHLPVARSDSVRVTPRPRFARARRRAFPSASTQITYLPLQRTSSRRSPKAAARKYPKTAVACPGIEPATSTR